MHSAARDRGALSGGDNIHRAVAVVGADEHDVYRLELTGRLEEVLDALPGGDSTNVEYDWCGVGNP